MSKGESRGENSMRIRHGKRQQGVVLIISLMILLLLSIIGIAVVSNATLEERMANNFQQSTLAFQGAETAIRDIVITGDPTSTTPAYNQNNDQLLLATDAVSAGNSYSVTETITTTGTPKPVPSITATSTITPALTMCTNNSIIDASGGARRHRPRALRLGHFRQPLAGDLGRCYAPCGQESARQADQDRQRHAGSRAQRYRA